MPETTTVDRFRTLTCLKGKLGSDPLLDEIQREVSATSALDTMKSYIDALEGKLDNNARPYLKLARLFAVGRTPDKVEGHHDGIAIGLRTGDEEGLLSQYGNFMGLLWSTTVGPVAPWAGKSFNFISPSLISEYTAGFERCETPTYLGINHFKRLEESVVNRFSFSVLTFWMHLKEAPEEEKERYGHDRNGGLFIAGRAESVYAGTPREVFRLNYRWPNLGNVPPFTLLIDELVELTPGLYLGQLLFATKSLLDHYDPERPNEDNGYEHFGYFLLMDDSWAEETRRVFPHLGPQRVARPADASVLATRSVASSPVIVATPWKFTHFTFADPVDGNCNDAVLAQVREDMQQCETVLDLLKFYSHQLMGSFDNRSPYFLRLHELFNRGIGPVQVRGFLHGALISFHTEGYYKLLNVNTLNVSWLLGRYFTPWTGKTFEPIPPERLNELTNGYETGEAPTFWGTNTLALRTAKQRIIGDLMKLAGVWSEAVPLEEGRNFGYDLKSFFFIARQGTSINEENDGKKVFLFNYRWAKLRTFPPDNYCIDELVAIAEGLYLGQLIYATNLLKAYDPKEDPSTYKYRLFGYFLLMDDEWQQRRLRIGLDPYNI